jgi:uncharacterized protein YxeA
VTKQVIAGVVTLVVAIILGTTGWLFSAVVQMPTEYIMKTDHDRIEEKNSDDHERIERKIDLILNHLMGESDEHNTVRNGE